MPILNATFGGEARRQDGTRVPVPGPIILSQRGPVMQVNLSVGQAIAEQIRESGRELPPPVSGLALIDTGASVTCVDDAAAQALRLPVIDVVTMTSASHVATQQNVYPLQIEAVGFPMTINAPRVMGAALQAQGLVLLIGRDVLQHCLLVYNGLTGSFSLSI
jgi:predicted aspartyl protease